MGDLGGLPVVAALGPSGGALGGGGDGEAGAGGGEVGGGGVPYSPLCTSMRAESLTIAAAPSPATHDVDLLRLQSCSYILAILALCCICEWDCLEDSALPMPVGCQQNICMRRSHLFQPRMLSSLPPLPFCATSRRYWLIGLIPNQTLPLRELLTTAH